ncbi:putative reverse transcriptase domain-containing protein, partial [Tanacetum coccineum]
MGHKEKDCRSKNVASGTNARLAVVCYECGERGHKSNACPKRADRQSGNVRGQAYVVRDAELNQGPNVMTGNPLSKFNLKVLVPQMGKIQHDDVDDDAVINQEQNHDELQSGIL